MDEITQAPIAHNAAATTRAGCLSAAGMGRGSPTHAGGDFPRFRRREAWPADVQARVQALLDAGETLRQVAARLHITSSSIAARCRKYGIRFKAGAAADAMARGAEVLRAGYATEIDPHPLFARYAAARGDNPTWVAFHQHAARLGLKRPGQSPAFLAARNGAGRAAATRARRLDLAPRAQALLNERVPLEHTAKRLGISETLLRRCIRDGFVTVLPPLPKVPKIKPPRPPKVAKPKAPKPPKPPKVKPPKVFKARQVRVAPPPKPQPTYQSVETWLAAGNRIKQCPAAMLVECQATLSDTDKAAMATLYAERAKREKRLGHGEALRKVTSQRTQTWLRGIGR